MTQRTTGSSSLNPHANVFVPVFQLDLRSPGYQSPVLQTPGAQPALAPTGPDAFEQLPDEILAAIIEGSIHDATDVARLASVCRSFQRVLRHAPLRVQLLRAQGQPTALSKVRRASKCLQRLSPGLVELSVAGLPLEDSDLSALLRALPRLHVLDVSGCQKLSPAAAEILVRASRLATSDPDGTGALAQLGPGGASSAHREFSSGGGGPPRQQQQQQQQQMQTFPLPAGRLCVLDMQRCFQLEAPALTSVLAALHSCSLSAVLCSHLTMDSWPPGGAVCACTATEGAADASSVAAPESCAQPDTPLPMAQQQLGFAQPVQLASMPARHAGLRVLALHNCVMLTPVGLQAIAAACPHLQLLLLGGSTIGATPQGRAGQLPGDAETWDAAVAAVRAWTDAHADSELALVPRVEAFAVELAVVTVSLMRLHALEITFFPPGIAEAIRDVIEQHMHQHQGHHQRHPPPQVWDMREAATLQAAAALASGRSELPPGPGGWAAGSRKGRAAASMALKAATACSSAGRRTPLHIAAEQGALDDAQVLLRLGASVAARDRGGGTPLFRACFHGHAPVVSVLLAAGSSVLQASSHFETPLYIAALRGHVATVDLLVEHHRARGLLWQDPALYEAGWTPLMAAAVADRVEVAQRLLEAAGPSVARMVAATNKYGQTALHLAARRGCMPMLRLLLSTCGPHGVAALRWRDVSGDTPAQLARKKGHGAVEAEIAGFLQAMRLASVY